MEQSSPQVLLIDDDPTFVDISVRAFEANVISYATAFNGIEALDKAKSQKPSLILLDIMMPGIDGFALLGKLRQMPETAHIPVWMLTNLSGEMNKDLAKSLGASDFLVKAENSPSILCEKIKTFLSSLSSNQN